MAAQADANVQLNNKQGGTQGNAQYAIEVWSTSARLASPENPSAGREHWHSQGRPTSRRGVGCRPALRPQPRVWAQASNIWFGLRCAAAEAGIGTPESHASEPGSPLADPTDQGAITWVGSRGKLGIGGVATAPRLLRKPRPPCSDGCSPNRYGARRGSRMFRNRRPCMHKGPQHERGGRNRNRPVCDTMGWVSPGSLCAHTGTTLPRATLSTEAASRCWSPELTPGHSHSSDTRWIRENRSDKYSLRRPCPPRTLHSTLDQTKSPRIRRQRGKSCRNSPQLDRSWPNLVGAWAEAGRK